MNNRVDYLSDKLVNLRGKLKSVDELVPPDSIANGVSVAPAAPAAQAGKQSQAQERRREQTAQLTADYLQRLIRRASQLEAYAGELQQTLEYTANLQRQVNSFRQELEALPINSETELTSVQLGELYRAVDKARLLFFETDGKIELLLAKNPVSRQNNTVQPAKEENFKTMLKKGWALALSLGLVLAAAMLAGAAVLLLAWR